ncbi:MAG: phospholipase D-like domain-containing protein, partial [Vicinamibacterales bacterium]
QLVPSFMTMFDNIWTNTQQYANYANVPPTLVRNYPTAPIDPRLNFPPKDSYQDRLIPLIDREPAGGWIDVDMYRITLAKPIDALIRAAARGVRIRMYLEPNEYTNTARPGNKVQMDRLVAAAQQYPGTIEIRMRQHAGLNHQKTIWFHSQHMVAFGTSNWSDASDDNQLEANIFTDTVGGDPLNDFLFSELGKVFERKWNNLAPDGSIETVAWRTPTLPPPAEPTTCGDPNATNFGGPLPCTYPEPPPPPPPPPPGAKTIVVYPAKGTITGASWQVVPDDTAAESKALWNPNANKAKVSRALAAPASYVEKTFEAMTGTAYHVWVRLRAQDDSLSNDSVHIQFSDSVTQAGAATQRIGTTSSAEFLLQDGPNGSDVGWGWADNGWGVPGALIYFAATGTHTVRIQAREDGPFIDQIVLSPDIYLTNAPGPHFADSTILPEGELSGDTCTDPTATNYGGSLPCTYPPDTSTVVLYPAKGTLHGNWQLLNDDTAAGKKAVWNPNANQAKVSPALTAPANYVDAAFAADGGTPYHLWLRMRAEGNSFSNDSVHLQFSDSVTSTGDPTQRIGTSSSAELVLQNGSSGPADHSWGWTDNGWDTPGAPIYFAATGTHTLRIQQREDGAIVDQIVLSPVKYFTDPPGPRSNDNTILAESGTSSPPTCTLTLASSGKSYGSGSGADSFTVTASDPSCTWTASDNASWVTITAGASGTGTGDVAFTIDANTGAARTATITAGGKTFAISQAGSSTPACTFTLSPTNASYHTAGGSGVFTVTAAHSSCTWSATSNAASWLAVSAGSASGTGNGTVSYTVTENTGAARSGAINVGGQAFAATQDGVSSSACGSVTLDATSKTVGGNEANWVITVTAP